MFAVVAEQPWVELGITGVAHRAGAQRGKHTQLADASGGSARLHGFAQTIQIAQHMHHALAMLQGTGQRLTQSSFLLRQYVEAEHRQFDGVLLEAVQPRKVGGGQKVAIDAQMGEAARARPVGQFGVNALAVHHQRRQQADVLTAKVLHQLRGDFFRRLRRHWRAVMDAVLGTELDKQQPQKVPDFGGGAHGGFAPAPAQALLDRHRGRNAIDRVHLGPARRLHDRARIGVERLQVTALTLVEQNVKRQG